MTNPYLSPQRVRAALRALELRPTRGMGQNFLVDGEALARIVAAAELSPNDLVVEVGPGLGVLTWELTQRAEHTVAVELDRRLAARLRDEFRSAPLSIVEADVLRVAPAELLAAAQTLQRPYKLIANLPYAITSAVLRHFLEASHAPELSVLLVQWEVAQRITATQGNLSILAHSVQLYAEAELVAQVPASSFIPAPAVASAILRLRRRPAPAVVVDDVDQLFRIIKAGFHQARKQLGNALPSGLAAQGRPVSRAQALAALAAAGVSPQQRAETVSLTQWAEIYRALG
ncbi:16S rRNA (adenine(1518)-N(6)/adenine(1519)-N(6))-dimethyltransferase RsmA [Candidatus Viridilinea mediisalina]|uniref:Ribosomal RNA small subunit methyltransferase A n=1 Tax=Candidatus Viridilinea mediisalina TaxID=2024553 RepID=A0A2A6RFP0_9CHLR|nr:16S rRNA (adenine(1518)-N(6)/adenine(1519)-N(6))-dimethyltransferase RsmA [Candidatus Viridilinea mediisalina]PDW01695.1 16S rRNA (adenine(1518)-N(6)/adenine(1519)-N(6))-dimethyltransferase [Candidatus Viridilinea mediisalina]